MWVKEAELRGGVPGVGWEGKERHVWASGLPSLLVGEC